MPFEELSKRLLEALKDIGLEEPTSIQKKAIPLILSGRNTLIVAPTGYGKTEAALIPVFEAYLRLKDKPKGTVILYVTPLRALNRDLLRRIKVLCEKLGLEVDVRHGDTDDRTRRRQALKPPKMLITTPETLQAILPGRIMRGHFKGLKWVIVDEVHELLSSKRGVQLAVALERLKAIKNGDFQLIGISATLAEPKLAAEFISGSKPMSLAITEELKNAEVIVDNPQHSDVDFEKSTELALPADAVARIKALKEYVKGNYSLVFTNTREHSEVLASRLKALAPEVKVGVHHGSLSKDVRREAEEGIREGELNALICTSSMELGIDIGRLDMIIQYMSPRQVIRFVHRIGRSGHGVGKVSRGLVITVSPEDSLEAAVIVRRMSSRLLEKSRVHELALDVLAHQIAGLTLDFKRIKADAAYEIIKRAYPYRRLTLDDFIEILNLLNSIGIVRYLNGELRSTRKTYSYYFENLSTIPDVEQYAVKNALDGGIIGVLDQEFVGERGEAGLIFIMRGQTWRILSIDHEKKIVNVEPTREIIGAVPSWEGELIPVSREVASEVYEIISKIYDEIKRSGDPFKPLQNYKLTKSAKSKIVEYVEEQSKACTLISSPRRILVEGFRETAVIHIPFGDLINRTLALTLTAVLSNRSGYSIGFQVDPYRICLLGLLNLSIQNVVEEIKRLKPEELVQLLEAILPETSLFKWRFWHVAKRIGVVSRDADYNSLKIKALIEAYRGTPVFHETFREILTDKLDLKGTMDVLDGIARGEISVDVLPSGLNPSPIAMPILERALPQDVLRPVCSDSDTLKLLKLRLMNTRVKLICIYNNDWETIRKVADVPEKIRCPRCKSTLIAVTKPGEQDSRKIIKNWLEQRKMGEDTKNMWMRLWQSASLVQSLGRLAVMVMAGRGIGPTTASRILSKPFINEEQLLKEIHKAEIEYIRTRPFWD
ncbi:DEAD/DEAH box helicase [Candidatus Bathyarchaeota archaeon]|nr:DEAD/DEAH box helicase [Candidatus Bathyarchaeota archaeon]